MRTTGTIAIIGATGSMGSALTKSLSSSLYRLLLFGRDVCKLDALFRQVKNMHPAANVETISCATEACWEADIIIPAVPYQAAEDVADKIRAVSAGKIVISISNPPRDNSWVSSTGTSAAEELQKLMPHSKVIKAFNTSFSSIFANPVINGQLADMLIAGNDEESLETVSQVVRTAGFNPVIVGGFSVSKTLENMQRLLNNLSNRYNYGIAGWKVLHN